MKSPGAESTGKERPSDRTRRLGGFAAVGLFALLVVVSLATAVLAHRHEVLTPWLRTSGVGVSIVGLALALLSLARRLRGGRLIARPATVGMSKEARRRASKQIRGRLPASGDELTVARPIAERLRAQPRSLLGLGGLPLIGLGAALTTRHEAIRWLMALAALYFLVGLLLVLRLSRQADDFLHQHPEQPRARTAGDLPPP